MNILVNRPGGENFQTSEPLPRGIPPSAISFKMEVTSSVRKPLAATVIALTEVGNPTSRPPSPSPLSLLSLPPSFPPPLLGLAGRKLYTETLSRLLPDVQNGPKICLLPRVSAHASPSANFITILVLHQYWTNIGPVLGYNSMWSSVG